MAQRRERVISWGDFRRVLSLRTPVGARSACGPRCAPSGVPRSAPPPESHHNFRRDRANNSIVLSIPMLLVAIAMIAAVTPRRCDAQLKTANRIIALVNDDVITQGDLNAQLGGLLGGESLASMDGAQAEELKGAIVERLIEARLIMQEAKRLGLTVSSDEVAAELNRIKGRLGSEDAYAQMLQKTGLAEEQLKQKLREQLLVQKAIDQVVRARITISPTEIAKASGPSSASGASKQPEEEIQAYHLLIRITEDRSVDDARALANRIFGEILEGAKFDEMAKRYSDDPHAGEGGLLGWVRQGELLPELDKVLFTLKPGELSGPVQTRLGFHFFKVADRRPVSRGDDAAAEPADPRTRVYQEKFAKAMERWLKQLKDKAYVEVMDR